MANGFNTEVLRRSVGRNPRTLLEFADLPQVQPGPSKEVMIADMASQTIKGIGQQILQSKKLDLDAQRTAAQIGMAQDTHNLNVRKQDYTEKTSSDNQLIEAIQKADYGSVPDIISQFSNTTSGNKLEEIYTGAYASMKPAYEAKESFEEFAKGKSIGDIIMEEGGQERLDSYLSLNVDDARFNIKKDPRIVGLVDEYNKNRGYYDLVSDKAEFQKDFGLDDVDYSLFRGLNAKQGQDLLVLKLKDKNPMLDPKQFERNFTVIQAFNREIQTNEQSIRNFQDRIKIPATTKADVNMLTKRIETLTSANKEKRSQIDILTKEYQPVGAPEKILDAVVDSTKQETVDGKLFNVDYNKAGEEIKRTLSEKEPADPFKVEEAKAKVAKEAAAKVPKDKFTMEDVLSVFSSVEDREVLDAQYKKMIEEGTGLTKTGQPNALSLVFRKFLQDKGFFDKLKNLRKQQKSEQWAKSPEVIPMDTSAYEF